MQIMDLRQVEIFVSVAEHGTLTGAARALGITQPAISAALGRLERSVGFPLFHREARGVALTAEGSLLRDEALRALAGVASLDDAAAAIGTAARGSLTIASNPSPGIAWLPGVAAAFRRERPDVTLTLLTRSSREVRDLVAARAFDLGIAEPPFDSSDDVVRRYRFPSVVAMRADHPLAIEPLITPALMSGADVVALLPAHSTSSAMERAFQAAGADLRVVAQCEFFATALSLAREGAGICLADPMSAAAAASADLCIRPFAPIIPYELGLLRPSRTGFSRLAEAFASAIDQHVRPYLSEPLS